MSLGSAFRQSIESMSEDKQKEYKDRIMTNVIKQFSEVIKKQKHDILNGIGDLIQKLHNHADNLYDTGYAGSTIYNLALEAATTIDILAERIVDSENNSALRVYSLEQQLLTKQAYIEYLEKRLGDSSVGFVKILEVYAKPD